MDENGMIINTEASANATAKKHREPRLHISKRMTFPFWKAFLIRCGAFAVALGLMALVTYLIFDIGPADLFVTMFKGAFNGKEYIVPTLVSAAKLLCIAVALAPAFKMRFWNIGAEGQVLAGALAAAFFMHDYPGLPNWLLLCVMLLASIVAGALWGLIPAFFKAKMGTNETLFTLMMNYIAMNAVRYFCNAWKGRKSELGIINGNALVPETYEKGQLRYFWSGENGSSIFKSEETWYILAILVIAVVIYFYMNKTKQGYEISVVGDSQNTARYAGINVNKVIIRTMMISGAICGICGFLTVTAQDHTLSAGIAGGYGFTAIIVAWMSKFSPPVMAGVAILVVALENGAQLVTDTFNSTKGFPSSAASVMVAVLLLFIIGSEFFINYKIKLRGKASTEVRK